MTLLLCLWRLEKALRGELFSQKDVSQIEDFMRIALAEAKEAQLVKRACYVCCHTNNPVLLN